MAVIVTKPDKYAKCICCGNDTNEHNELNEFKFFQDNGNKTCITLCKSCVYRVVNKLEELDDKRTK